MEIFYVNIEKSNIFIDIIKKRLYTELEVKENMGNICRFIPPSKNIGGINIIHFVYETKKINYENTKTSSVYQAALVVSGKGTLHVYGNERQLKDGDLFFIFPSVPFSIEAEENFEYIYISYMGVRANMIMDNLGINYKRYIFHDMKELKPLLISAINSPASDLKSEAVLLYIFAAIEGQEKENSKNQNTDTIINIKKYIDEHFTSCDLDLKKISNEISYSEKYISSVFKKQFKMGVSEYIATIRIQYACTLMEQGLSSVSDIALLCGFSDPLYFSKVFKKRMSISPRAHINEIRK